MDKEHSIAEKIKRHALELNFDACGICSADTVDEKDEVHLLSWLERNYQADMDYLARNTEKRLDPRLLVENAKSIISLAINYYPEQKQSSKAPQFAYYSYGKDYHDVVKAKLNSLLEYIKTVIPHTNGRVFVDTAPILERYWAAKAGIGFIGKNTLLIIPKKGSFFFLGEVIVDVELDYDKPISLSCGSCTRCLDACPTSAIEKPYLLNSTQCISYQTIENKGEISNNILPFIGNHIYGCDVCQQVCPWNRFSKPHTTDLFNPSDEFLALDYSSLENMSMEDYRRIFKGSAIKRAKHSGLVRNYNAIDKKK